MPEANAGLQTFPVLLEQLNRERRYERQTLLRLLQTQEFKEWTAVQLGQLRHTGNFNPGSLGSTYFNSCEIGTSFEMENWEANLATASRWTSLSACLLCKKKEGRIKAHNCLEKVGGVSRYLCSSAVNHTRREDEKLWRVKRIKFWDKFTVKQKSGRNIKSCCSSVEELKPSTGSSTVWQLSLNSGFFFFFFEKQREGFTKEDWIVLYPLAKLPVLFQDWVDWFSRNLSSKGLKQKWVLGRHRATNLGNNREHSGLCRRSVLAWASNCCWW